MLSNAQRAREIYDSGFVVAVNEPKVQKPTSYVLYQNYPNPFNPSTKIQYEIPATSDVTLNIYDVLGRKVATLVNERKSAGHYEVEWDASHFASGVYFYQITARQTDGGQAGNFFSVKKTILLK